MAEELEALCAHDHDAADEAFIRLAGSMHDINARISRPVEITQHQMPRDVQRMTRAADGAWILRLPQDQALSAAEGRLDEDLEQALSALESRSDVSQVILDLRPLGDRLMVDETSLQEVLSRLMTQPLRLPAVQHAFRGGFDVAHGMDGMSSGMRLEGGRDLAAKRPGRALRMSIVADERTVVTRAAWALIQQRRAELFISGSGDPPMVGAMEAVPVGNGREFRFTTAIFVEVEDESKRGRVPALDAADSSSRPLPVAGRFELCPQSRDLCGLTSAGTSSTSMGPIPGFARTATAVTEPESPRPPDVPDAAWRAMAAIKLWSSIKAASRPLTFPAARWNAAFDQAAAAMTEATSKDRYVDVLRRMLASLNDGHARLMGRWMRARVGEGALPVRLRRVGSRFVVKDVDGSAPMAARRGDQVLAIDGKPIAEAVAAQLPFVSAATPASRELLALDLLSQRPVGQTAVIRVKRGNQQLDLKMQATSARAIEASQSSTRMLSTSVGYLDLSETEDLATVDAALGNAASLIVDLRRYPRGAAWALAGRLLKAPMAAGPTHVMPRQGIGEGAVVQSVTTNRAVTQWRGRVIALIGPETQSQGEYSVLLLKSVTKLCTVGQNTFGTYGNVAAASLPGGLFVSFTANDVLSADGKLANPGGLVPDTLVEPSLADIVAGSDPVLNAAVQVASGRRSCTM
jgi:C-terminal processing protease CtpA/Prc